MTSRMLLVLVVAFALNRGLFAAEPVTIELRESAATTSAIVTMEQLAKVEGGHPTVRASIARLDVTERPKKENSWTITRRQVEFRLKLAGYSETDVRVTGAERTTVSAVRTALSADRVVAEATTELVRRLGQPSDVAVDVVQPVAATLPEIADDDDVKIVAVPQVSNVRLGRMQMNVTIHINGEKRLALPVFLNATAKVPPKKIAPIAPLPAIKLPPEPALVKIQQRVTMSVRVGDLTVSAQGDALQEGKLGQSIRVLNIDSKKVVVGTVSGPGTIEVELGGGRP